MTTNILHEIRNNDGKFPRGILLKAIDQRDEIIPELLEILENTFQNAEGLAEDVDYLAHIYALYLLAQFKEQRAYPLVVALLEKPYDILNKLLDDTITEGLSRILASVFNKDVNPLKRIIENEQVDEFIRSAAMDALVVLVAQRIIERDEIVTYFLQLFHGGLEREYSYIWDALAGGCYHLYPIETIEDIEAAYDEGLVNPTSISFDEIKEQLDKSKEEVLDELHNDPNYQLIQDTICELEWWACFDENENENENNRIMDLPLLKKSYLEQTSTRKLQTEPYRAEHKVGRNDPCPCGSGEKYKKCCGKNS